MESKKIKIAVISGGPSSEHEVSLKSAKNVIKALDLTKFEILSIRISKDGLWFDEVKNLNLSEKEGLLHLKKEKVDIVFITIHGEYGEDGTIQELLEKHKIKYTGSNSNVSKVAMDKVSSSKILTDANLNVPSFISINKHDYDLEKNKYIEIAIEAFNFPLVVKPTDRGSSVGIKIVLNKNELEPAILGAFKYSKNIMIQEFIKGRELTCAVLEGKNGEDIPLIPTEIVPDSNYDFFNYDAKYLPGASIEITPPDLSKKMILDIQNAAIKAHTGIGCTGISRSDFILKDKVLYILEINTIPGMTETSLLPQGAAALGIEFSILIETIIESALRK